MNRPPHVRVLGKEGIWDLYEAWGNGRILRVTHTSEEPSAVYYTVSAAKSEDPSRLTIRSGNFTSVLHELPEDFSVVRFIFALWNFADDRLTELADLSSPAALSVIFDGTPIEWARAWDTSELSEEKPDV